MRTKILNILVIILTLVLWGLQMLPQEQENSLIKWISENKYNIAGISGVIVILIHIYDICDGKNYRKKEWLRLFFKHIIDEHLGGNNYDTRITLLRPKSGARILLPYLYNYLFLNFVNNFKCHKWGVGFHNIPIHLGTQYLVVYTRYSYPKQSYSYTHIRIIHKHDVYNGVAEKCFRKGTPIEAYAPYIYNIELPSCFSELSDEDQATIRKYMEKCHFHKDNYDTLVSMNRRANNLYAVPIAENDQTIWGVLIVDNLNGNKRDLKAELQDYIDKYSKIISFTISSIK